MLHLSKEFSIELALSLIEFSQALSLIGKQLTEEHLTRLNVSFNEINDEVLSDVFYTDAIDRILFDSTYDKLSGMKIYKFPSSVPRPLIIENNLKNFEIYTNSRNGKSTQSTYLRPILLMENNYSRKINLLLLQLSTFYCICFELYHKYIQIGSEFEINIASLLKNKFVTYFQMFDFIQFINVQMCDSDEGNENYGNNEKILEIVNSMRYEMSNELGIGIIDYIGRFACLHVC